MSVEDRVLHCMEENGIEPCELNEEKVNTISSLDFVSFIVSLEEEFNIEFPVELLDISIMTSFEKIVEILKELI